MKFFTKRKILGLTALASSFTSVNAALPTAAQVTGGSGVTAANTSSPIAFISELLTSGAGLAAVAIAVVVTLGVGWSIYSAFAEARQKGDWTKFGVTASIGIAVGVGVVLLAIMGAQYAT